MAHRDELLAHLGEVPLFSRCSKRDLQQVSRQLGIEEVAAGVPIVTQGHAGDAFFVLLEGTATVRRNGADVGELRGGDYFGELAVLDPAPRNADVVAATPVTIARLRVDDFRKMLREVPAMNERLLAGLARRVRESDQRSVH